MCALCTQRNRGDDIMLIKSVGFFLDTEKSKRV